ncbi:hypothetical protein ACFLV4_00950 [Chloroflexota bacterium]
MRDKLYRLGVCATLAIILFLGIVLVTLSYTGMGVTCEVGTDGLPLLTCDRSAIPQPVIEDATELAKTLFGDYQEKADNFVSQVLAIYSEAKDKDFVILFNSGGWGWTPLENNPAWETIFNGIKFELNLLGYESLALDYKRTEESWRGRLEEAAEMANFYPRKAEYLASRVTFLTKHIPHLRVILAGESNGTVIADRVMTILEDNPQVYSIQTGPPFWHNSVALERALVLTSNGIIPDSFSQGNPLTMISANLKALISFPKAAEDSGAILYYVKAPGHEYWWQYPEVYSEITNFLKQNFSIKWR